MVLAKVIFNSERPFPNEKLLENPKVIFIPISLQDILAVSFKTCE
jgi:hypothetical protein